MAKADEQFERECENRSIEELEFFADHGYWPEAAERTGNGTDGHENAHYTATGARSSASRS